METNNTELLRQRHLEQLKNAKRRGIDFKLTFEEWLSIWNESGKLHLRGQGSDRYCMARNGDTGPYEVGNVTIKTNFDNLSEILNGPERRAHQSKVLTGLKRTEETKARMRASAVNRAGTPAPAMVEIDGVVYPSMAAAGRALGFSGTTIVKRMERGFPGYKRL